MAVGWSAMVGSGVTSSLTLGPPVNLPGASVTGNGTLYLGSYDGYVYAVDAGDGAIVWRAATGTRVLPRREYHRYARVLLHSLLSFLFKAFGLRPSM